ncbi:MAG: acetyl-CoA acetyltransferase [Rhodospirillales bacterium]|nr:acetyl-CoA acetyltransferase [Rhodospirillales bacterium]
MAHMLRGAAAVVGLGLTEFGTLPERSHLEVMAEASHGALSDAGLTVKDVDGLFVSNFASPFLALQSAEYLGIDPAVLDSTNIGGSTFVSHVQAAAMALATGVCNVALIAYGSTARSGGRAGQGRGPQVRTPYEDVYRPRNPIGSYAMAAARHMHEFGTTRDQLSSVAVSARAWAAKNPRAEMREPITVEDVANARMICDPFTVLDCCLVSDGGAAIVMVRSERAGDFPKPPVYLLGIGMAMTHDQIAQMPDITVTAVAKAAPRAFEMAEVSRGDIDVMEFYDAFTINTILFLEDLGFCAKGEGGALVESGAIAPGGRLPVNTNGGGLSCVHPGMYGLFTVAEAVEQLRGEAEGRQVEGAEIALCNGNGGKLSSQVTAIFGTGAAV